MYIRMNYKTLIFSLRFLIHEIFIYPKDLIFVEFNDVEKIH